MRDRKLVVYLSQKEEDRLLKLWKRDGQGLSLSPFARQKLLSADVNILVKKLAEWGLLDREHPDIRKALGEFE